MRLSTCSSWYCSTMCRALSFYCSFWMISCPSEVSGTYPHIFSIGSRYIPYVQPQYQYLSIVDDEMISLQKSNKILSLEFVSFLFFENHKSSISTRRRLPLSVNQAGLSGNAVAYLTMRIDCFTSGQGGCWDVGRVDRWWLLEGEFFFLYCFQCSHHYKVFLFVVFIFHFFKLEDFLCFSLGGLKALAPARPFHA